MCKLHKKRLVLLLLFVLFISVSQLNAYAKPKRAVDTKAPTAPQNITATSVSQTSVSLKWTSSSDNVAISGYQFYKDSTYIASTAGTAYTVSGFTPATTYSFYVKAKDTSGNISPASNVLTVTTSSDVQAGSKIVSAYYAGWSAYNGYTPLSIKADGITHINYAFAAIGEDLKITMGDSYIDPTNFAQLKQLKTVYPQLKTLISIGGWNDSGRFSDVALSDWSRTVFADSVIAFIKQNGFDGVDIDWEYPVSGGLSTNIRRPEDKTNFTLLLQKLREKLDAQGQLDGKKYLLAIAGGAGSTYASNTELNLIANYVDFATIMTYDLHGIWDAYTDLNAPLYAPTESSPQYKISVDQAVKLWISKGFPASKLVMGVPFYGYKYNSVSGGGTGIHKSYSGGSAVTYDTLLSSYINNTSYTRYFHSDALVPWLFNGSTFISYDDEVSIMYKAKYIVQSNLAGAAIWELSQNKGGQLLNALILNLK